MNNNCSGRPCFYIDKEKKRNYYIDNLYIDNLHTWEVRNTQWINLLHHETLRQRSQNVFELKAGTLYPLLHSLEAKGFLTSYEQEQNGKTRVYYSISKNGNMFLKEKKEEWAVYVKAVSDVLAMGV